MPEPYWNYRIIKKNISGVDRYAIYEVYYEKGKPTSWVEDAVSPWGDSVEDLRKDLSNIQRAMALSVLLIDGDKLVEVS